MWALILKGLTWVFGGGFKEVSALIDKVAGLFRKTEAEKKQENEKEVRDEFKKIEEGGRPKWDD